MPRVLIVDDAAFMRMTIKDILVKNSYQVVGEAEGGKVAIDKFRELKPDLVTMDVIMSGLNGVEVIQKILKEFPQANFLVISAMGQQAMIIEAVKAGAKGFLVKPFTEEALLQEVRRILPA